MKKVIGIVGRSLGDNSFGVGKEYLQWISKFGIPRIIMPGEGLVKCDCLVLQGGKDIAPSSYNESPGFNTSDSDVFLEDFDNKYLKSYVEAKIPIFAICRGFQYIGAMFGYKLEQDNIWHSQSKSPWEEGHKVNVIDAQGNILKGKRSEMGVTSTHHQTFSLDQFDTNKDLIPLLVATDVSEIDRSLIIVEAFKHNSLPIFGCQFHPERMYDGYTTTWMNNLLGIKETVLNV